MVYGDFWQLQSWGFASDEWQIESDWLSYYTIPSVMRLVSQGFIFIQDNDTKLTSKLCQKYIKSKQEQRVLQLMS